jgi:hypothetical protein
METIIDNPFSTEPITIRNTFWTMLEGFNINENSEIKTVNVNTFVEQTLPMEIKVLTSWIKTSSEMPFSHSKLKLNIKIRRFIQQHELMSRNTLPYFNWLNFMVRYSN